MKTRNHSSRGFTIIELMVTMTLASVLLVVAIPSLTTYRRNADLTSATNTLLSAINAARSEAMKRGMNAMVVPTNNGTSWNDGWVVFVDTDRSQTYTASADTTVLNQAALPGFINVVGNGSAAAAAPYLLFDASGYSKLKSGGFGALTLTITRTDVATGSQSEETRRIIVAATGRTRSCKPSSATDSSCSASSTE